MTDELEKYTGERAAFVEGAKWWQFHANGSTAFPSERDEMEAEAARRYPPYELARLEREIAEEAATETVDWNCISDSEPIEGFYDSTQDDWNDDDVAKFFEKSVRYLELRGLLERHPERRELVRFVEKADD